MQARAFVGIDLSQETMTVAWWQDHQVFQTATFPRTADGYAELHAWCARKGVRCAWVMEATGSLWQAVAQAGEAYGYPVYVLNPHRVHTWSQTRGQVAKTDALDAALIAECAWMLRRAGELHRWSPRAEALQQLQSLLRLRTSAQEQLVRQQALVRALREQGATEALALAEPMLEQLAEWVKQIEQHIAQWEATHSEWQAVLRRLRTVPGIGRWGALVLLAEGGDLRWLRDGKAFARYCGLAPVVRQSGRRSGLGYGVCRDGNRWLRRALYLAALSAVRSSGRYKAVYEGLLARGKARKVALCAVARRLALVVYALQRDGVAYDPSRGARDLTSQHRISLRSE